MTRAVVVAAEAGHIEPIVANARPADVAELWALGRYTPRQCLELGLRASVPAFTALLDDAPVAMWGAMPASLLGGVGCPWMVGTTALHSLRAQKDLLRLSRPGVAQMREIFRVLVNVVDERNTAAHRWLRWLGFTLGEPFPTGPDHLPFRAFYLETP